jgi:5-formyltetrahydrofolate cyclo-ligase
MPDISVAIRRQLNALACYQSADWVVFFHPRADEIDLRPLWRSAPDYQSWVLPRMGSVADGESPTTLYLHLCPATEEDFLVRHRFGVMEPEPTSTVFLPPAGKRGLMILPALTADTHGQRLGYGKGFYDRLLGGWQERFRQPRPTTVVVLPDMLFSPQPLPVEVTDQAVDWIITETFARPATTPSPLRPQ